MKQPLALIALILFIAGVSVFLSTKDQSAADRPKPDVAIPSPIASPNTTAPPSS